jgi:hypothetical protein
MLSRDMGSLLAAEYDAHAVLVGTYSRSGEKVFVSARILRLTDGALLAAYEYYLPFGGDIARLLDSGADGASSGDALWHKYNARGQAFATAVPSSPPAAVREERTAAPAERSERPASGAAASPGRASVVPEGSRTAAPLPGQIPLMSGGKRIQP